MAQLGEHEVMALRFLAKGPDCIGVINSEEQLAAALVYGVLQERGLVVSSIGPDGPVTYITPAGLRALSDSEAP